MAYQQIQYGTVVLPFTRLSVDAEIVYAEDGATREGVVYHFSVRGVLAGTSQADFAAKLQVFRCQLHTPRLPFSVRWSPDGITWTTLYGFDDRGDDSDYGPKPSNVRISSFSGGLAADYSFDLTVKTLECFPAGCAGGLQNTTNILSLTANYSHAVDEAGFTIRTVSGRLTVTSDTARNGKPADYFRPFVTPKVPANFRRVAQSFRQSADCRRLDYSITDREVMWTLPVPISEGNASFTVHVRGMGGLIDYHLSGKFSAPASVGKDAIVQRVGELLQAKFPPDSGGFLWDNRSLTEDVYGNSVSFQFSGHMAGIPGDSASVNWLAGFGGTPPGSDGKAQFIGPYGGDGSTVSSGVKAGNFSFPYDACSGTGGLNNNTSLASNLPTSVLIPGDSNPTTPSQPKESGSQDGSLSDEMYAAPYIAYHEVYSFMGDNGIVPMIVKKDGADPVFVRVRPASLKIIQSGYCVRDSADPTKAPVPPTPFGGSGGITLLNWDVKPSIPEPLGIAGQFRYTLHWTFVGQYQKSISPGVNTLGLKYPNDPRVKADPAPLPTMPELVIVPPSTP